MGSETTRSMEMMVKPTSRETQHSVTQQNVQHLGTAKDNNIYDAACSRELTGCGSEGRPRRERC